MFLLVYAASCILNKYIIILFNNQIIRLLQILHRVCRWKNLENCSLYVQDMDKSLAACFLESRHNEFSVCHNAITETVDISATVPTILISIHSLLS